MSTYRHVDAHDPVGSRFVSLTDELSVLLAERIKDVDHSDTWGEPRPAEGTQVSYGRSRGWHSDLKHLGHLIITITIEGQCVIGVKRAGSYQHINVKQKPNDFYAIWGAALSPTQHCVKVNRTEPERLSLTFRYVLSAPAAPPANIGGLRQFTVGDRVRAHWQRGSVAFAGRITAVDGKGRFSVNYDDGDNESGVDAKFLIPEVTRHSSATPVKLCDSL